MNEQKTIKAIQFIINFRWLVLLSDNTIKRFMQVQKNVHLISNIDKSLEFPVKELLQKIINYICTFEIHVKKESMLL